MMFLPVLAEKALRYLWRMTTCGFFAPFCSSSISELISFQFPTTYPGFTVVFMETEG